MDLIEGSSVRLPCAFAVKHVLHISKNLIMLANFQEDACLVAEKAITRSQKISGTVTVACIQRYI